MSATPEELDQLEQVKVVSGVVEDDEFETDEDTTDQLKAASRLLKKNAILFEFLADTGFCKRLTKKDRKNMESQADQIYTLVQTLDEAIEELESE